MQKFDILHAARLTDDLKKNQKLLILLIIIVSAPNQLFSQTISERNSVTLSIGTSVPVGDFSKSDPNNTFSRYSKTGETIKFSFQ